MLQIKTHVKKIFYKALKASQLEALPLERERKVIVKKKIAKRLGKMKEYVIISCASDFSIPIIRALQYKVMQ